jgi:hypothetical protein
MMLNTNEACRDRMMMIQQRIVAYRAKGILTSKGEPMSLAAIGRTIDPPVARVTVYKVASGMDTSRRVMAAINKELNQTFFVLRS